jgi:DNA helicase IV
MVRDVAAQVRIQFSVPAEEEFAGVIAAATQTLDGRPIDDGTPMEDAKSVDVEDYAVMFELDRMRAAVRGGKPADPKLYDCIVLDEAQELAPLELALVGRSLARKGTLLAAGDADQQVDPTSTFSGWGTAMAELGAAEYQTTELAVSYRCPPEVTAWARRLRDGVRGDGEAVPAGQGGLGLELFESECHLLDWLGGELRAIYARDPGASVVVIGRTPEAAQLYGRILDYGLTVRVALEGRFTFGPGVQVTCVEEVKGLEFDYVVVPDAGAAIYPDTAESRRALYVAATRAIRQLLLACAGRPSPLVAGLALR